MSLVECAGAAQEWRHAVANQQKGKAALIMQQICSSRVSFVYEEGATAKGQCFVNAGGHRTDSVRVLHDFHSALHANRI